MATLILKAPHNWRFRPPISTPLNRESSLARGLIAAVLPPTGGNFPDVKGNQWTATGGPINLAPGQQGQALTFNGTSQYLTSTSVSFNGAATTILSVVNPGASRTAASALFSPAANLTSSAQYVLAEINSVNVVRWYFGAASLPWTPPTSFWSSWHRIALRGGPSGLAIWVDGAKVASSTTAASATPPSGIYIGAMQISGASPNYFSTCSFESAFIYNRELKDMEVQLWTSNPYAMFAAPSDRRTFAMAGGSDGRISYRESAQNRNSYQYI